MICPNKRLVGVNVDTERMEVEEESLVSDEVDFHPDTTQECDNLASLEIEELICNDGGICLMGLFIAGPNFTPAPFTPALITPV